MRDMSLGHNMSHADGNSTEGESIAGGRNPSQTGTGCFRNFDHFPNRHRRSNSSILPCLPTNEGPPQTASPSSQRKFGFVDEPYQNAPAVAPLAQDETQLIPSTPKECKSPSADSKKSDTLKKTEKIEEFPSEFECCFCASKDFKEFVDAENHMPFTTSDFRNPVCLEMRILKESAEQYMNNFGFPELDLEKKNSVNGVDLNSMDSSDTFASCTTHPFNSQGDLTSDIVDASVFDSNLYVNPLDKSSDNSPVIPTGVIRGTGVKKSASGDTALRSLGTSPMDEHFKGFGLLERGSRVSLNDSPYTKNRKTRFQGRPRTRFGESRGEYFGDHDSQESLEKKKKTSFMSSRGLASASRIINQHLFGLQSLASKSGKNSGSKSSLSVDSIDSRTSPQLELHRRSKSILKKSDSSSNRNADPESERLITDNMSGSDVGFASDYSPNKRLSSPPVARRSSSQKSASKNLPSYQQELERTRLLKSQLFLLDDILKEKKSCNDMQMMDSNKLKMCVDNVSEVPLYICPPPPPLDNSPTEETRLLLSTMAASPSHPPLTRQTNNSISKGHNPSS